MKEWCFMESVEPIFVAGPSITKKEIDYVKDAVTNAWYDKANIFHERFEKAFREYIGVKYAIALPSCTSAIHLALLAKGIGKDDEVIVPDITWIASVAPVSYVGAKIKLVDIEPDSWCMSADAFEKAITPKTKAVIPVDLYGNMPNYKRIREIADKHGIFLLEDAAEAIGSEYEGHKAGSLGDVGVFSFHGSKTMTTGEGGMLVTNDEEIYEKALFFRDHGRSNCGKMFWNDAVAYKYKMSSMQAALGLAQLERIDELVEGKKRIFNWYKELLGDIEGIRLNSEANNVKNSYWMATICWDKDRFPIQKEELIQKMQERNINTRPFFYPLSMLPPFKEQQEECKMKNKIAYSIHSYSINIPCGLDMTKVKVKRVCENLLSMMRV